MNKLNDSRPYGTPSYCWDGCSSTDDTGKDPESALSVKGKASISKWQDFKSQWNNSKDMFALSGLSQEAEKNTGAPANGVYLSLKATTGVHNALLLSTIDSDRWSVFSVWLCDSSGKKAVKIARSANNANGSSMSSTYTLSPRNTPKESSWHAWMSFPVSEEQVNEFQNKGKLKFLITSGPYNSEGALLYLSGFALVPNPKAFCQHPALSLHWALNGDQLNEVSWHSVWANDGLVMVEAKKTSTVHVKVLDPSKDLLITVHEHNNDWYGGTLKISVASDKNLFYPSTGISSLSSRIYTGTMHMRPQCVVIPKEIVQKNLVTSNSGTGSCLALSLYNPGNNNYHFRGIDTESI